MQRCMKLTLICHCESLLSVTKTPSQRGLAAFTKRGGRTSRVSDSLRETEAGVTLTASEGDDHIDRGSPVFVLARLIRLTPRVRPRGSPHSGQCTDTKACAPGSVWCHNCYARCRALYFRVTNHVLLSWGMCHFKENQAKLCEMFSDRFLWKTLNLVSKRDWVSLKKQKQ